MNHPTPHKPNANHSPYEALERLKIGNKRFLNGSYSRKDHVARRKQLLEKQEPYAAILCCSDSRVSPEIIFDTGLGELFVVRTAGNVVDKFAIGSLEYAVEYLGVSLLAVVGHEGCGALAAACSGDDYGGSISEIVNEIRGKVALVGGDTSQVIRLNIGNVIEKIIANSSVIRNGVDEGRLVLVGSVYQMSSGIVEWL